MGFCGKPTQLSSQGGHQPQQVVIVQSGDAKTIRLAPCFADGVTPTDPQPALKQMRTKSGLSDETLEADRHPAVLLGELLNSSDHRCLVGLVHVGIVTTVPDDETTIGPSDAAATRGAVSAAGHTLDAMASKPTSQAVIEGFLLRCRRVLAHSLIRDQADLMQKLHSGNFTLKATVNTKTGKESYLLVSEYPPEEALESLASRVRPLVLASDPIYYENVLQALEELVGTDKLNDEIDLAWWHNYWREVIDANLDAQAYSVITQNGQTTDRKLMYAWLYGDVIHAQSPRPPAIRHLSIDQRYYAAASGIARICDRAIYTQRMIEALIEKGLLTVDPEVFTQAVIVSAITVEEPVNAYTAPVGTPVPQDLNNLDLTVWKTPHQDFGEVFRDDVPADDLSS